MTHWFIPDKDFRGFVAGLMAGRRVIGPVARRSEFVFEELKSPDDLRLDYDVTILPPKKAFFPTRQDLVAFSPDGLRSCIAPVDQVLLGVHFYDVKAIDQLDQLFEENHPDNNYLANRRHTTIVASSIQNVSKRAFFASVGRDVQPKGHDAFLTRISGGTLLEPLTPKGEALAPAGSAAPGSERQREEARRVNEAALAACPEALTHDSGTIARRLRASFGREDLWKELSRLCFSCGTCNIVCPTCYCFDVQDAWNLDQASGFRTRTWDGCQLHDFSKVSLGAGGSENFRPEIFQRYRHRMMRKATYLNETLGGPACVGCGRCSAGCVPDIADPVKIIERVMET